MFLNLLIKFGPISDRSMSFSFSKPSLILFNPFCTVGKFIKASNKLFNTVTTILTLSANAWNPLFIKSLLNKKSLNFTIASPILAVTSRIFKSNAFKTADTALKARLSPFPATVLIISIAANNPLNVRLSFSALSFDIISDAVNL